MGFVSRALILMGMVSCLTSVAHATNGRATYYAKYTPSSCYGFEDKGNMIATVNNDLFANKAACGTKYRVTCTGPSSCKGGSVDVIVVSLCVGGCGVNALNLSQEAFSAIANLDVGSIIIDYNQV